MSDVDITSAWKTVEYLVSLAKSWAITLRRPVTLTECLTPQLMVYFHDRYGVNCAVSATVDPENQYKIFVKSQSGLPMEGTLYVRYLPARCTQQVLARVAS